MCVTSFAQNLNKLLIVILGISFSENAKGSDAPTSYSPSELISQQVTRYVLGCPSIEILLPRQFDDNTSHNLITKLSNIINESSKMVDSAYTEQELRDFSEKSESTVIPAQESFFASQNLFFGNKYIVSYYINLHKRLTEKVSEKTLHIMNFVPKLIILWINLLLNQLLLLNEMFAEDCL